MHHLPRLVRASALALLLTTLFACSHPAATADSPPQPAAPLAAAGDKLAPPAAPTAPTTASLPGPGVAESATPAEPTAAAPSAAPSTPASAATATSPDALPPLPKGTVVLHVGDSMADALGKDLKRELEALGVKNVLKAKEATYIPQWAGFSMGFPGLVASHNPDLVIVTLGGNEVGMPDPTQRAEQVKKIVATIGDRPCLWIAPPLWGPHTGILEVIRQNCAPCVYVDTNQLIPDLERLGDHVHPTLPERKRWAKFMIGWLRQHRDPAGKRPWDMLPGAGG
ncbi:MAG: SGNH/GDSL hydrolase family protein [Myxococcales bacterium]|nr:SGNH/GDSL hydrolase family protein [Myxococcales bacterium]